MTKTSTISQKSLKEHESARGVTKFLYHMLHILFYALPAVLFFSYYPVISLVANSSMNFELSLPLIWLVLFDIIAFFALFTLKDVQKLPQFLQNRHHHSRTSARIAPVASSEPLGALQISDRHFFLFALFPLYATISALWSANPLRAILTAGIIWLIFFAVFAILFILPRVTVISRGLALRIFFLSTAIVCVFCLIQSVLDLCGVSRDTTLLCAGCTYRSFGFPHPSGFAIEPQFMGNLLLAPTLTALYLCCFDKLPKHGAKYKKYVIKTEQQKSTFPQPVENSLPPLLMIFLTGFFCFTLFFTFSRGAIYAFAIGVIILFVFAIVRRPLARIAPLIITPVIALILALITQGIMAAAGPTSETFSSAVAKSIHQLSLGVIDFRSAASEPDDVSNIEPSGDSVISDEPTEEAIFSGYVAESTNIRLSLNSVALSTWLSAPGYPEFWIAYNCHGLGGVCTSARSITPCSIFFGTGLGSAGTVMHIADPDSVTSPKEIVQNQPISLLLETGLVGIALIVLALILIFSNHGFWHHPALPALLSLAVAYLITLQFFSGLPNALQIYLMPPFLWLVLSRSRPLHATTSRVTPDHSKSSQISLSHPRSPSQSS